MVQKVSRQPRRRSRRGDSPTVLGERGEREGEREDMIGQPQRNITTEVRVSPSVTGNQEGRFRNSDMEREREECRMVVRREIGWRGQKQKHRQNGGLISRTRGMQIACARSLSPPFSPSPPSPFHYCPNYQWPCTKACLILCVYNKDGERGHSWSTDHLVGTLLLSSRQMIHDLHRERH